MLLVTLFSLPLYLAGSLFLFENIRFDPRPVQGYVRRCKHGYEDTSQRVENREDIFVQQITSEASRYLIQNAEKENYVDDLEQPGFIHVHLP